MTQIELPALHSEPLIYFLLHSGVFVLILGALFFALGLWFGALTWGKYKLKSKAAHEENQALLGEIAVLKRKLAEQSLRHTSTPNTPPAFLTEVLPNVSAVFPERQALYPTLSAMPAPAPQTAPVIAESAALVEESAPMATAPAPEPKPPVATAKPVIRAKAKLPAPEEPLPTMTEPMLEVEPFGFLLTEPGTSGAAPTAEDPSALNSIIKGKPGANRSGATAKPGKTTKVKLPKSPPPIAAPAPEIDPALGPIYREAPPNADDLTKIKGITSLLEKRLHELGVHTYHQIASWEESHIREFSTRLAFKDRIAREDWGKQAQNLEKSRQSA